MAVKRYDGSAWQTVAGLGAQGPAATSSSIATWVKTASGGETSLSGNDDNSQSLSYTVGQELVFINGTLLKRGSDYTATNGTSITGLTALAANDVATVWTVNAFSVTNAISSGLVTTTGDMIYASGANTPARLAIGSTDQVLKVSGGIPAWGAAPAPAFKGVYLTKSAAQSIPITTYTAITWDTEAYDTDGFHSNTTNTSRITIPSGLAGYYSIYYQLNGGNGDLTHTGGIAKNGTRVNSFSGWKSISSGAGGYSSHLILNLAVGDYVEAVIYTSNTLQIDSNAQNAQPSVMWAQYLGA